MTSAVQSRPASATPFFAQLRADLAARLAQYRLYRRTLRELSQLSTRDLDDLGLSRGNLEYTARQAAGYL